MTMQTDALSSFKRRRKNRVFPETHVFFFPNLTHKIPRTVPLSPEMAAKSLSASSILGNSLGITIEVVVQTLRFCSTTSNPRRRIFARADSLETKLVVDNNRFNFGWLSSTNPISAILQRILFLVFPSEPTITPKDLCVRTISRSCFSSSTLPAYSSIKRLGKQEYSLRQPTF